VYLCTFHASCTVPYRTHPGAQISKIFKVTPGTPDPVNKYFSLTCTNPGGHLAQPVPVQVCVYARTCAFVRVHVCWCACACTCMCASVVCVTVVCVTVLCVTMPAQVCVCHPPNFILPTPETPEPLDEYIFYDTDITPEGQKTSFTRGEYGKVWYSAVYECIRLVEI